MNTPDTTTKLAKQQAEITECAARSVRQFDRIAQRSKQRIDEERLTLGNIVADLRELMLYRQWCNERLWSNHPNDSGIGTGLDADLRAWMDNMHNRTVDKLTFRVNELLIENEQLRVAKENK